MKLWSYETWWLI